MSVSTPHDHAVIDAGLRAVKASMGPPHAQLSHASVLTALMRHGGLHTFLDSDIASARLAPLVANQTGPTTASALVQQIQSMIESFFYRLCDQPGYIINSDLMSFIAFPHDGVAYEDEPHPNNQIPAAFTFTGQFIDHDLTMNAVDLTIDQTGAPIPDNASPVIDLDSVYGPRTVLDNAAMPGMEPFDIFNPDGTFKLVPVGDGYDLPRFAGTPPLQPAYIVDARNDENQILLQLHILIMRVHNRLVQDLSQQLSGLDRQDIIAAVRKEVVLNWQSVVLNDYLPRIVDPTTLEFVLTEIKKPDYGALKHKPLRDLTTGENVVRMPHEFSIGFRFGHSMLRPDYTLNSGPPILLFNNREVGGADDLRGSRPLSPDHVIDWNIFYPSQPEEVHFSLLIDGLVTPPVFDLPETTIPDDIKYIGNLPHRNLIRSRMVGVVSGEELADFYGVEKLQPCDIVDLQKFPQATQLFSQDGTSSFKTPLWYYILKEAEKVAGGHMLGPLGSRLVAEVIAGGVYYGNDFRFDDGWTSRITGSNKVVLRDLINYATAAKSAKA